MDTNLNVAIAPKDSTFQVRINSEIKREVGGQAVLGRQHSHTTPWLTERHGYDPTSTALLISEFILT